MRIFSGIQPTGNLHIGNYLGAIKQWVELQEQNECIFCIVDLHALTSPFDPEEMKKSILEKAVIYLAAGINPEKSIIFVQSSVQEHSELAWILNTITPLGELKRMTQYKEKSKKFEKNLNAGLMNYPVLMAADILLYQTELVPVGKDQEQHVELTRIIARKFNKRFGKTFKIPESRLPKTGAKIMSLTEPNKKMSKSDKPATRINIFDEPEEIKKKIMAAKTDNQKTIKYDPVKKPGISNLLSIYGLFKDEPIKMIEKRFKTYKELKSELANLLILKLEPLRRKRKELIGREAYVKEILSSGAKKANIIAESTIKEVREKIGIIY